MSVPLVVVIGAGASRGAGKLSEPKPPLTTELFDSRFNDVLSQYDLAVKAGRHIAEAVASSATPPVFEDVLRGLRESNHAHHRHMALAVPFYLQELLWQQSERHNMQATAYERLTRKLLELESIFFVTLNYDVLLDRQLNSYRSLNTLDAYIEPYSNWALLKPHGSVTWSWPLNAPTYPYTPQADLTYRANELTAVAPDANWWTVRGLDQARVSAPFRRGTAVGRYPALALPEGPQDVIVMPKEHTNRLLNGIRSSAEIDMLVIGYSGYDKAILELLRDAVSHNSTRIRRTTVVNTDQAAALGVYRRFEDAGLAAVWQDIRPEPFSDWASARLDYLVSHYNEGPSYVSVAAPSCGA